MYIQHLLLLASSVADGESEEACSITINRHGHRLGSHLREGATTHTLRQWLCVVRGRIGKDRALLA